jgi:hypothetical protein
VNGNNLLPTLLLTAGVFIFYGLFYRYHLGYQENFGLFLFTSEYAVETLSSPGGLAEYCSRFLTQFCFVPLVGAAVVALLLAVIHIQTVAISRKITLRRGIMPLALAPSLCCVALLCDEQYLLTGITSLIIVLAAVQLYLKIRAKSLRIIYLPLMAVALYALTGVAAVVMLIICIGVEMRRQAFRVREIWLLVGISVLIFSAFPFVAKHFFWQQYSLAKLFAGANYYRFTAVFPYPIILLWLLAAASPFIEFRPKRTLALVSCLVLAGITAFGVVGFADFKKEEVMRYDCLARHRQWDAIIRAADRHSPSSPLSVALLNLALAKSNRLGDSMFRYYQNGVEGLMPTFVRDFTVPMVAGEIYYHTGFVNTAQRYAFEAMEAIPDFQKSGRALQRLAETNIINGEYAVAQKYLRILRQTLFYRSWAEDAMACLLDEKLLASHQEWMDLRRMRTRTDFLFSEGEKSQMLGLLLQQDMHNRMAYEYLMAYCLLTKDLNHFRAYLSLGNELNYMALPVHFQEALVYLWGLSNTSLANIPYPISPDVMSRVNSYAAIYTSNPDAEKLLARDFSGSYWYYLHFRK